MSAFGKLFGTSETTANADTGLQALFEASRQKGTASASDAVARLKQRALAKAVKPPEAIIAAAQAAKSKSQSLATKPKSVHKSLKRKADDTDDDGEDKVDHRNSQSNGQKTVQQRQSSSEKHGQKSAKRDNAGEDGSGTGGGSSSEDDEPLVHETVARLQNGTNRNSRKSLGSSRENVLHADESPADKNGRTVFLGNVPVACATKSSARKALVRHLISTLPTTPIDYTALIRLDTIRFRSIQLAAPVPANAGLREAAPADSDTAHETEEPGASSSEPRSRRRARQWREEEEEATSEHPSRPKFLTAAQKRKVAFITGDIHEKATTCNAYAVWTTRDPAIASPQQLAGLIVKHANNTEFEGLTCRVDHVNTSQAKDINADDRNNLALQKGSAEDEKRTLFLGGIDFEETEQSVRTLCEGLMTAERGNVEDGSGTWVERVRLVKDPETGLGKGFAYVLFKDRECVDEMLAVDGSRVKLSKRKLRMERCKSTSAIAAAKKVAEAKAARLARAAAKTEGKTSKNKHISKPRDSTASSSAQNEPAREAESKVRPDIGEDLRKFSKDERRAIKSSDAERLARRMEKKEMRRASLRAEKAKSVIDAKLRKTAAGKVGRRSVSGLGQTSGSVTKKKVRVRSDRAERRRNTKKIDP